MCASLNGRIVVMTDTVLKVQEDRLEIVTLNIFIVKKRCRVHPCCILHVGIPIG